MKKKQDIKKQSEPNPSTLVQSQMAARVKVQIDAAKSVAHAVLSEGIELPEISEYLDLDSEDEDQVRILTLLNGLNHRSYDRLSRYKVP